MANAPSVEHVLHVLEIAAVQRQGSPEDRQHAVKQLDEWQSQPGYHNVLQTISQNRQYPPPTRILGLTQLKNGIDKHWRAGSTISPDEQNAIRGGLRQTDLNETDGRIVSLTAVIFASIARRDFPSKWPSLFDDLVSLYQSVDSSKQHQVAFALKIIQKTITEFQTLRLALPRKAYFDAAPTLLRVLVSDQDLQQVLTASQAPPKEAQPKVFHTVLLLKCIRRLAVGAFECPHYDEGVVSVWNASQQCLRVGMTDQTFDDQWWMALMRQLVKMHLTMAQSHPVTFALLQPQHLVHYYWDTAMSLRSRQLGRSGDMDDALEEGLAPFFILKALLLMRATLKAAHNTVHTVKFAKNRDPEEPQRAREHLKSTIFQADFITKMFEGLIGTCMIYAPGDIEEWTDEAEDWEIREYDAEDAYEQSARPCAERLFLDITLWYKPLILDPLLQLVRQYSSSSDIFIKDAVYSALGIAASRIHEHFDFNQFLDNQIAQDMANPASDYKIIRRRIGILLAQWAPINETIRKENKAKIYSIYEALLDPADPRNDQVVRVTSGKRLKEICMDFEFEPEAFNPHASTVFRRIVDLMIEVSLPENKIALLQTLREVVEQMDLLVLRYADEVVSLAQRLWEANESEQLMKKAIVGLLARLTGALKGESGPLQTFVIPLLRQVLDPASQENLYLWEDSLDLLHELIQQSKGPANPDLIYVTLDYMQYLDRTDGQNLEKLLQILESLLLLAAGDVMQSEGPRRNLLNAVCPLMTTRNTQVVSDVTACLEHLIRVSTQLGDNTGLQALVSDMSTAGFTKTAFDCLLGCWAAHQTHGPNRKEPPDTARSETYFYIVIGRVLLNDPHALVSMVRFAAEQRGAEVQGILKRVMEEWFSHIDNVGNPAQTKMMVMALTRMLELQEPWLLTMLQDYMTVWTGTIVEMQDGDDNVGSDCLVVPPYGEEQERMAETSSPETDRRTRLTHSDVVRTVNLSQFIKSRVDNVVGQCGGFETFEAGYLANVDKDVVQQFMSLFQ